MRAGLRRALAALTPGQRAVVVLRDVYGWSNAETARELGITEITAKVRLHRARLRLRALLEAAQIRGPLLLLARVLPAESRPAVLAGHRGDCLRCQGGRPATPPLQAGLAALAGDLAAAPAGLAAGGAGLAWESRTPPTRRRPGGPDRGALCGRAGVAWPLLVALAAGLAGAASAGPGVSHGRGRRAGPGGPACRRPPGLRLSMPPVRPGGFHTS